MAATHHDRPESPSPSKRPSAALGADLDCSPRCISAASSVSHGSATTRESLGSLSSNASSRHSSASFLSSRRGELSLLNTTNSRHSTGNFGSTPKRRGYMRPQGTDFAASARSRESVLSLGSIAHLQYYFARTGLLDGKGGHIARKNRQQKAATLDFSSLASFDMSLGTPKIITSNTSDVDSSYASVGSSPDLLPSNSYNGGLSESPIIEEYDQEDEYDQFVDWEAPDPNILPPTTSTYMHREKPVPKPPSINELRTNLRSSLKLAAEAVEHAKMYRVSPTESSRPGTPRAHELVAISDSPTPPSHARQLSTATKSAPGWFEVQGMHILDVITLAIRSAKVYYTSHDQPDRIDALKPEKELRKELFTVMEMLKRMATRNFQGGMRDDEVETMESWVAGLYKMLEEEEVIEAAEEAERAGWLWLKDEDWPAGTEVQREYEFMLGMLDGAENTTRAPAPDGSTMKVPALPEWKPIDRSIPLDTQTLPTPFLQSLQNGLRLVQLHNAAVRKSRRRFGAIGTFHTDTQKPYRCADNLRYWIKAAELRWEVNAKVDALGVVYNSKPEVWVDFEDALLQWCRKVREEITIEILSPRRASAVNR